MSISTYTFEEMKVLNFYRTQAIFLVVISFIVFAILFSTLIFAIPLHPFFESNREVWLQYSYYIGPLIFTLFVFITLRKTYLDINAKEKTEVIGFVENMEIIKRYGYRSMLFWDKSTPFLKEHFIYISGSRYLISEENYKNISIGNELKLCYSKYNNFLLSVNQI